MSRVLFAGTPDFALPCLEALVESGYQVVAVLTQPDRVGAKNKVTPPPVKVMAQAYGIPVLQYAKVRAEGVDAIRALEPDVMVTAAYGQIISQEIIDIPRCGVVNVHGSLLPALRGASPIQQAVLDGMEKTGVTIMRTALAVDSGDIILQKEIAVDPEETAGELFDRMAVLGAVALIEALPKVLDGTAVYTPQNHADATFCKMLKKEDGVLDWGRTVWEIRCHVRGMNPWPSAYTTVAGKLFKVWKVAEYDRVVAAPVGTVCIANAKEGVVVQAKDGRVALLEVQPEGSRRMSGKEYMVGHSLKVGEVLQ